MTKRQLNAQRRAAKRPAPRQKRFRGWHWENDPRPQPGERLFIGRCRSRQGLPIFVTFRHQPIRSTDDLAPRCRHCGRSFEAVKPA